MNNMTRRTFLGGGSLAMGAILAACSNTSAASDTSATSAASTADSTAPSAAAITGTFTTHVQGYDWGCGVDQVILSLDQPLEGATAADFSIIEHKQATDFTSESFPIVEVDIPRTIKAVSSSADNKTVTIDLACAPDDGDSPLLFSMTTQYNTWSDPYNLLITAAEGSSIGELAIDPEPAEPLQLNTSANAWELKTFTASDGTEYASALFKPATESKNLVVWLHGMGEGGTLDTDPYVTILANKVVALSEDAFQKAVGGAHILAPQCPTFWMDTDGKGGNFGEGGIQVDGTSFYTKSLEEFIDSYAKEVGAEKIILAGCSNGGFMTMVLSISRPDAYAGVVPICEALTDDKITDEQIASLKDLPMYFVYSKDDTTVDPTLHEEPTIKRLKDAGKTDETLHVSVTDHVVDTSGEFKDAEGNPYQYAGHWSWIYFDNNECDANGLKAWDFIGNCLK